MENEVRENIMGYESIPKLIMKLSLPLMLSMLIQALYNVVASSSRGYPKPRSPQFRWHILCRT